MSIQKSLIILIFLFATADLFPQNLFPLNVGDRYIYTKYQNGNYVGRSQINITASQVQENKTYYFHTLFNGWIRYDTVSGVIFIRDNLFNCPLYPNERVVDSLKCNAGDSVKYCVSPKVKCVSKELVEPFGVPTYEITFLRSQLSSQSYGKYYLGYGSNSSYGAGFHPNFYNYYLVGGVINGVGFGDTNLVHINLISGNVPSDYSLFQNYPNPFNPTTKIIYEIKSSGLVSLKVFDLQGKEVAMLVNEKQNAGSYAVDFNSAEFNLPSGIYFYTLNAGEFKETKKMILIK